MTQRKKPTRVKAKRLAPGEKFTPCTPAITLPALAKGEKYAGIMLDGSGAPKKHLILLEGGLLPATWHEAMAWAKKQGGALPTRQEQLLLMVSLAKQFRPDWYWSCELYAGKNAWAWSQNFSDGTQVPSYQGCQSNVRAVRRVSI